MRTIKDINELKSVSDLERLEYFKGFPSPETWRDQLMYLILPDRFSNGLESSKPLYNHDNPDEYKTDDVVDWYNNGNVFQGGTIKGVMSKLTYLKGLGITTIWLGPVFKQRADLETYHGYGIQNFLDVDPRFGTREDLVELVEKAHNLNMYVVLDIIYNHTGNNWFYYEDEYKSMVTYEYNSKRDIAAWRSGTGDPVTTIHSLEDGIWPNDFQDKDFYTRDGYIEQWDSFNWENPLHKDAEFRRGDFFDLKDLNYDNPRVLESIVRVYQYWIEMTDCDGFRIDTVKHVPREISRKFCSAIHEYTECIGKNNFLLLGEVTGGSKMSIDYLEIFGRNLDAVLDIGGPARTLAAFAKGQTNPLHFFNQFTTGDILGTHREAGRFHVSILDDHDKVGSSKQRFSAGNTIPNKYQQMAHAVGIQLTTLGIPCIYYGTEQAFDGDGPAHNASDDDRFIRESMFGAIYGAFETSGCQFFNRNHPTYLRIAAIAKIRNNDGRIGFTLRRGRQYYRETSVLGYPFAYPDKGELVAWSRIMADQEVVVALNTNGLQMRGATITLNAPFYKDKTDLKVIYKGDLANKDLKHILDRTFETVPITKDASGRVSVYLELEPAGMAILG